ncbi:MULTISPECIES: gamma carbonic anhydrase family protein [unclassified Microbacterium]|uniref:gamma carbonic anhydrase family protein n=1 Tax=unclassified Microbacterium TaxID=2609290 RepID=UPI000CFC8FB8|nr:MULTISPECIES: gamma carbonic anhydrase family protein [unclassified Microbacterium]PQZ61100.1 gamma carbonic anhydrase family protein [Microbacterium sp. MYb43]PQZ82311.1 gamma carbonic anhydrase family protein [Microbacterium sp. MYb40]PRB23989.1 gamma carbonic anhydrase family protein [Microbacterium sp. MYb54]PRB30820.1 gamma carbonic anhydrase family protein [Microbacterium sp. MYb50]PRB70758.1 gamma carbonic anhydrase family protein [Microbacterium sp. MYb24]
MSIAAGASVLALPNSTPTIDPTAFVADGARIVGDVSLAAGSSVWYNAVLRGDSAEIVIGPGSNVQDNVSMHVDSGHPVVIGAKVSIGHNAVVHGCTVGDGTLIGMGSVILSGAVIGAGCLIAGGAVVLGGTDVPAGSLIAGVPAKVRRMLSEEERAGLIANADIYLGHLQTHAAATPV